MSNKIDAYTATAPVLPARAASGPRDPASSVARAPLPRPDAVVLTGEARLLQQVQQQAGEHDGVDPARVEQIRRELAEGRYQARGEVIAAALMRVERGL